MARRHSGPVGTAEDRLATYRESGDRSIRNDVVEEHRYVAEAAAGRFRAHGEPFDDLVQVALVGVLQAAERFDPRYGVPFAPFAALTARGELRRYHRDATGVSRLPRPMHALVPSIAAARDDLHGRLRRTPSSAEVADYVGASVDDVNEAGAARLRSWSSIASDEDPVLSTGARGAWEDGVVTALDATVLVERLLAGLPSELRAVVRLRYADELSRAEIACVVRSSPGRVRAELRRATRHLRAAAEAS